MSEPDDRDRQIAALQDRLTRLSAASVRINESLDLDDVLQGVLDSASALTGARYGVITTLDYDGPAEGPRVSGMTAEEARGIWEIPGGRRFFEHVGAAEGPLRSADLGGYAEEMGFGELRTPMPTGAILIVPIRHRGDTLGSIHLSKEIGGGEFTAQDEETLVMFASQVALVVANARRHRDERRAKAGLETLIDTSPVGVAVFDVSEDGAPVSFNREATRIVDGLRDPDQSTEQLLDVLTVRRADGTEFSLLELSLAETLGAAGTVRAEEIELAVPDGRSVSVLLNSTSIKSDGGDVESVVVTMQDMAPIEETERLRAEFLGMVSHELRMPLTSIWGSAMAILEDVGDMDPAERRQFLRIVLDQVASMRNLIGDLLDVARIEAGALPVDPEPAEVAALIDRARKNFSSSGGRDNLHIEIAPDLPLVMADRHRIAQVVGNLLANAAKHSQETSPIRVSAAQNGVHVEISVADEGQGIPVERLPHLFRKFARQHDDPASETGLGLAICKGIVEAHGGRIRADSDGPGLGARFSFTLPAANRPTPAGSDPARTRSTTRTPPRPSWCSTTTRRCSATSAERSTTPASTPSSSPSPTKCSPRHGADKQPELVLLDVMLPDTDGIAVMRDVAWRLPTCR